MCQAIVRHLDDEAILTRHDGDRATPRPISASVLSAERDERSNSLVFLVKVSEHGDGYMSYFLQRKHDSFAAMHAGLMAQPSLASRTPPLPPKPRRYSKPLDAWSHVDRLSEYLTLVVSNSELLGSQDVRGFLELSAADQLASKLREREEMFLQLVTEKDRAIEEQQRLLCSLQAATNIAGQREHLRSLHPETMTTLQAVVYDHEKCGSGNESWWVYKIRVEFSSAGRPISQTVKRRYREFRTLHQRLRMIGGVAGRLPALPSRSVLSPQGEKFVDKRQVMLQRYLHTLLCNAHLRCAQDVRCFLGLEENSMGRPFAAATM